MPMGNSFFLLCSLGFSKKKFGTITKEVGKFGQIYLPPCTMAAKKFRPSFFRHFKKIGVVHSLLSL
jgi:hypothetical protein